MTKLSDSSYGGESLRDILPVHKDSVVSYDKFGKSIPISDLVYCAFPTWHYIAIPIAFILGILVAKYFRTAVGVVLRFDMRLYFAVTLPYEVLNKGRETINNRADEESNQITSQPSSSLPRSSPAEHSKISKDIESSN